MTVVYHPAAAAEHFDHLIHYRTLNITLARAYAAEFEATVAYINEGIQRFPVVAEGGIRRHFLSKFPIALYFRDRHDQIEILAVAHKRRRPLYWTARL